MKRRAGWRKIALRGLLALACTSGILVLATCSDKGTPLSAPNGRLEYGDWFWNLGSIIAIDAVETEPGSVCFVLYADTEGSDYVDGGCGSGQFDPPIHVGSVFVEGDNNPYSSAFITLYAADQGGGGGCTGEVGGEEGGGNNSSLASNSTRGIPLPSSYRPLFDCEGGGNQNVAIQLTCPESVVRGSDINCTVQPADPQFSMINISWKFEPDQNNRLDAVNGPSTGGPTDSASWGGRMVWSGNVIVNATVNAASSADTAHVTVTARAGAISDSIVIAAITLGTISNTNPTIGEDIGVTLFDAVRDHAPTSADTSKGSGPNAGYVMRNHVNLRVTFDVKINTGQFQSMSTLWQRHDLLFPPTPKPPLSCTSAFIAQNNGGLEDAVEAHEGTTFQGGSHTRWYKDWVNQRQADARTATESLVYQNWAPNGQDIFEAITGSTVQALETANRQALDSAWSPGCNLIGIQYGG